MTFFTASEMLQQSIFFDVFNNHKYIMFWIIVLSGKLFKIIYCIVHEV